MMGSCSLGDLPSRDRLAVGWVGASYPQSSGKGDSSWASKMIPAYVKLGESCVFCQGWSKRLPLRNTKTDLLIYSVHSFKK